MPKNEGRPELRGQEGESNWSEDEFLSVFASRRGEGGEHGADGNNRRGGKYDPATPPPANAVRPLPAMPVGTGTGTKEASDAIATTVTSIVTVVMWPADWTFSDIDQGPRPEAGQPCSDFELLAGETTYKHIQRKGLTNVDGPFRCVRLQDPIVYSGP